MIEIEIEIVFVSKSCDIFDVWYPMTWDQVALQFVVQISFSNGVEIFVHCCLRTRFALDIWRFWGIDVFSFIKLWDESESHTFDRLSYVESQAFEQSPPLECLLLAHKEVQETRLLRPGGRLMSDPEIVKSLEIPLDDVR